MVDRVKIDFGQMDGLTAALAAANSHIAATLAQLDGTVSTLREEWTGEASNAYRAAHDDWSTTLEEMNRLLGRIEQSSAIITDRHRATEGAVEKLWG